MLTRILPFAILGALMGTVVLAQPAAAQPRWWQNANPDVPGGGSYYDDQGDTQAEAMYGPDPYADNQRFNDQEYRAYRREMARRYGYAPRAPRDDYGYGYGGDQVPYAAPLYPVKPQKKSVAQSKPVVKKPVAAKPATSTASASKPTDVKPVAATTGPPTDATTTASTSTAANATAATKPAKAGAVTCDKGVGIVSSFGFEKVASKSCEGASLVYSAERGGKPFEIEVNPKSGELTAVKKL